LRFRLATLCLLFGLILGAALGMGPSTASATPNVGQHIHQTISNMPVDGYPIPQAPYTFHETVTLHDIPSKTDYIRLSDYGTVKVVKTLVLGPCSDCAVDFDWTIDFSTWAVGRHELRFHVNLPDGDLTRSGAQRQFQSSGTPVCIVSCSPNLSGRRTPFHTSAGWYLDHSYAHALSESLDTSIKPCGQIRARTYDHGKRVQVFLNPDFHHNSAGIRLASYTDQSLHNVDIPCSAEPGDKLVIIGDDGQNAGVLRLIIGDGSARKTANYEYQSWWAKSGLVFPG
jgi:hypothetical protein